MPILQMRILEQHSWHGVSLGQGSRSQLQFLHSYHYVSLMPVISMPTH